MATIEEMTKFINNNCYSFVYCANCPLRDYACLSILSHGTYEQIEEIYEIMKEGIENGN